MWTKTWDEHLPLLTSAYRSSQNTVTEFKPNGLMLGWEVHQRQDIQSGVAEIQSEWMGVADFLCNLKKVLEEAQKRTREHIYVHMNLQCWKFDACQGGVKKERTKPEASGTLEGSLDCFLLIH